MGSKRKIPEHLRSKPAERAADTSGRRRPRAALLAVEEQLEALLADAPVILFAIDREGVFTLLEGRGLNLLGLKPGEHVGQSVFDVYRDTPQIIKNVRRALTGKAFTATVEMAGLACDVHYAPLRDQDGQLSGVIGVATDVTERKRAEEEQARTADDLRRLIDTANAPIFGVDTRGRVNEWNQMAVQITGYSGDEVMGRDLVQEFMGEHQRAGVKKVLDEALEGRETSNYELPLYTKGGARLMVLLNATTRRDAAGDIVGVVGIGQDITERKRAEEEQARIAEDLRRLIDAANAPIFGVDTRGRVNEWNQKAEQITGYSGDEVLGRDLVQELMGEEQRAEVKKVLDDALEGRETSNYEFPAWTKGGTRLMILLNATTRRDAAGDVVGVVGIGQDITERKRAEEELERHRHYLAELVEQRTAEVTALNKELEAFVHSVSHDLRAPLRSIDGFSRALLEDFADKLDGPATECLQRVRAASQRMRQLIDGLLALSRVTRSEMHRETVDLSALARTAAAELQEGEPERGVRFEIQEGLVVRGDASLLGVLLENLLDNAWKFTRQNASAHIDLGSTQRGGELTYFVRDNGVGFDMASLDRLFSPFQRLHPESEFAGTGVGLATVQRIIRRHGGHVWAEGSVGQGATFYFTLNNETDMGSPTPPV